MLLKTCPALGRGLQEEWMNAVGDSYPNSKQQALLFSTSWWISYNPLAKVQEEAATCWRKDAGSRVSNVVFPSKYKILDYARVFRNSR